MLFALLLAAAAVAASAAGGLRARVLEPATPNAFLAELFQSTTCEAGGADRRGGGGGLAAQPVVRTLAEQDFCQRQGDAASYFVSCAADGRSGALTFCSDARCRANCDTVAFISGACASPSSVGGAFAPSNSVRLTCFGAPPAPPPLACGRCQIEYAVRSKSQC